jgi:hypothetical protein
MWLKLLEKENKIEQKRLEALEGPKRKTKAKKKKKHKHHTIQRHRKVTEAETDVTNVKGRGGQEYLMGSDKW